MVIKRIVKSRNSLIKPPLSRQVKAGFVVLNKGEEVGEHSTLNREELIIIIKGQATVMLEDERKTVNQNFLVYIPPNKKHNIRNDFNKILKYMYVVSLLP